MGHYYHIHYTLVFKNLPDDIVEMINIQEQVFNCNRFVNQTKEQIEERWKKANERSRSFEEKMKDDNSSLGKFVKKWEYGWSSFLLYETDNFEWIMQGVDWPHGFEPSGIRAMHGNFAIKEEQKFVDFLDLVKPYVLSGSAWGWWESDANAFDVFL